VRPYERGDPLNRIHWRATARTGMLHSKLYEPSCVAGATLLLDFHNASFAVKNAPYRSELAITATASLANAVYQMGEQVGLITNGLHLMPLLPRLKASGLDSVTISIDSVDPATFGTITGNGHRVETVLDAIEAAQGAFGSVKLNTVLLKGTNDDQIEPLARRYRRPGFHLRFIEFMDVGTLNRWSRNKVISGDEVLTRLRRLGTLVAVPKAHPGETSERWRWADGRGEVGMINSITRPFCGDCSRVRLGADGQLYTCLFSRKGFDFRTSLRAGASAEELTARLAAVWGGRSDRYSELRGRADQTGPTPKIEMFAVGG